MGDTTRRDVNRLLYADDRLFEHVSGDGFRWRLRASEVDEVEEVIREAGDVDSFGLSLYEWQARALTTWNDRDRHGIIAAVTGSGKTRLGLAAIDRHLAKHRRSAKAVVLIPTIELAAQWRREIERELSVRVGMHGRRRPRRGDGRTSRGSGADAAEPGARSQRRGRAAHADCPGCRGRS